MPYTKPPSLSEKFRHLHIVEKAKEVYAKIVKPDDDDPPPQSATGNKWLKHAEAA